MRNTLLCGAVAGLMALAAWPALVRLRAEPPNPPAAVPAPPAEASYWMKRKLELSQRVLEGLALGDFERIAAAARTMDKLNTIELFVRGRNEAYRTQLELFRAANAALIRHADQEHLDGATLAFHQLTLSCISCHKHLRETKPASPH